MAIATVSPTTGQTLKTFPVYGLPQVDAALSRAVAAFRELRGTTFTERAAAMRLAADLLIPAAWP